MKTLAEVVEYLEKRHKQFGLGQLDNYGESYYEAGFIDGIEHTLKETLNFINEKD